MVITETAICGSKWKMKQILGDLWHLKSMGVNDNTVDLASF